jgi:AraC family transcriptional activator of pobA
MNNAQPGIPSIDLMHEEQKVNFAFRTMEGIHARMGHLKDVPHRHNYYTILWASKACGQHFIDYEEHLIRPNYIFFVNPGQVHQVITFGEPEGYVIMFTREFLHQNMISEDFITNLALFSDSAETPPLKIDDVAAKKLRGIVSNIEYTFNNKEPFRNEQLGAFLKLFLIECNKYAPLPDTNNTQTLQAGGMILRAFKKLVEEKFNIWHKVGSYADALNISPDYLNNVVKSAIGKTAKEFIQERLVLEAKRMGVHTHLSNKEIAFELGFDDPSHFSKFYKSKQGVSFSDFRKSLEKSLVA